ncbi:unnamed protein product, partial [Didymodactylos carnosus]
MAARPTMPDPPAN